MKAIVDLMMEDVSRHCPNMTEKTESLADDFLEWVIEKRKRESEKKEPKDAVTLCSVMRKDFHDYVKGLDNDVFIEACRTIGSKDINVLDEAIESNDSDPTLMAEAIDSFRNYVDSAIMDKITALKCQMSSLPGES